MRHTGWLSLLLATMIVAHVIPPPTSEWSLFVGTVTVLVLWLLWNVWDWLRARYRIVRAEVSE